MSVLRVYDRQPRDNPGKRKPWTYEQVASRKEQAERFLRDVLEDDDRADDIEAMSVEDYAAQRGKEINPQLGGTMKRKVATEEAPRDNPSTVAIKAMDKHNELQDRILKLEREKQALKDQLAEIVEIVDCDECSSDDHLEEIADVVHGKAHDDDEESGEE